MSRTPPSPEAGPRVRRSQAGNSLIEFALVLGVFVMLVFAIMEFSRAVWDYSIVSSAARDGVRYAVVRGAESGSVASAADIQAYVRSRAMGLTPLGITVTWTPDNRPGSIVAVQVGYDFTAAIPFYPAAFHLASRSQMEIAQ